MNQAMQEHISAVKELLSTSKDFYNAADYFSKHLGMNETFISLGDEIESALLQEVLAQLVERITKKPIELTLILKEVPEVTLIHGTAIFAGQFAAVCYFNDIDIGMLIHPDLSTGQTSVYRFSMIETTNEVSIMQQDTETLQ